MCIYILDRILQQQPKCFPVRHQGSVISSFITLWFRIVLSRTEHLSIIVADLTKKRGLMSGELRQELSILSQHYYSPSRLHVGRNHQRHTPPLSLLANPQTPDSILQSMPNHTAPSQPPQNVLIIICRVEDQLKERLRGSFRGANLIIYLFKTNCLGFNSPERSIPKGFWEENEVGRLKLGDTLSLPLRRIK